MISSDIVKNLLQFRVRDDLFTLSDHIPIHIMLNLSVPSAGALLIDGVSKPKETGGSSLQRRLRWDLSDTHNYFSATYAVIQPVLQSLWFFYNTFVEPLVNNPMNHTDACNLRQAAITLIETSYLKLTNELVVTANRTIPKMSNSTLKFWWNDELDSLKKRAYESNNEWILRGKPNCGFLSDVRKSDKYAYKLSIRKFKQAETQGVTDSLLESLAKERYKFVLESMEE